MPIGPRRDARRADPRRRTAGSCGTPERGDRPERAERPERGERTERREPRAEARPDNRSEIAAREPSRIARTSAGTARGSAPAAERAPRRSPTRCRPSSQRPPLSRPKPSRRLPSQHRRRTASGRGACCGKAQASAHAQGPRKPHRARRSGGMISRPCVHRAGQRTKRPQARPVPPVPWGGMPATASSASTIAAQGPPAPHAASCALV